jgi:DNA modification methylase
VAVLQLDRNFLGCEREEKYVRLAMKRLSRSSDSQPHEIEDDASRERTLFDCLSKSAHAD